MKKLIALLLAFALAVPMVACGKSSDPTDTTGATSGTTDPTDTTDATDATDSTEDSLTVEDLEPGEGVYTKVSYSVSDEDAAAAKDTVVATCGDAELTNGVLQIYYWMAVYDFLNEYSYYASYFGLDYTQPLDEQICSGIEGTWQHSFLEDAVSSWQSYQAMALMCRDKEIPMKEDLQTALDELYDNMLESAEANEFDTVDAMLKADVGAGTSYEDYYRYMEIYYMGYSYFDEMYQSFEITDADIEAYFTENEEALTESGYTKDAGDYYDVRHILIQPEGGTTDEDGNTTFSDMEWEACRQEAQALLDSWLAGDATEEAFAALAAEHSMDTGSNTNGGLYQYLTADTSFVEEFKEWYLDESRQVGDTGLVKTSYGYHIMYYSGDEAIWHAQCRDALYSEMSQAIMEEAVETYPVTMTYDDVVLGVVDLSS